jgi:succinate dehydrogenase hydrophobic anchor subunit
MATQEHVVDNVTSRPQRVRVSPQSGTLAWGLQRFSSYGLIIFLGVHMLFSYYAPVFGGYELTFEIANQRFYTYPVVYAINQIGLLTFALFHGLNGVRNVAYDIFTSPTLRRIITIGLIVIGLIFLYDGSLTLLALMRLEP